MKQRPQESASLPRKNMEREEKAKTGPLKSSNVKGAGRVLQRRLRKNRAVRGGEGGGNRGLCYQSHKG